MQKRSYSVLKKAAAAAGIMLSISAAAMAQDYGAYIERYKDAPVGAGEVRATGEALLGAAETQYTVDVPSAGLYNISLSYAPTANTNRAILAGIKINGEYPFDEAAETELARVHADEGDIFTDESGNERAPQQKMLMEEQTQTLKNTSGYYNGAYRVYFEAGENVISVLGEGAEFKSLGVSLTPAEEAVAYSEYIKNNEAKATEGQFIKVQAENAFRKSTSMLYPTYDRLNAASEDSR